LEKVYSFEPVPNTLTAQEAKYILGAQAQIWTEFIPTPQQAEYMALPRMCALAEVVWLPKESKDYDDFSQRLKEHVKRLEVLKVNFHPLEKK
jgi:hexosaminidase